MDRIEPEVALMAVDEVFKPLFEAMKAQLNLIVTTSIKADIILDKDENFDDELFS